MTHVMRALVVGRAICAVGLLAILGSAASLHAQSTPESQFMTPFFSEPIPTEGPRKAEQAKPALSDLLRSSREPTILLASDSGRASLLVSAGRSGFGSAIPLPVEAYNLHLAEGLTDTLWIGGYNKPRTSAFGKPLSYAYLVKIDRRGHLYWGGREFGDQTQRRI